jgi:thiosulfate dehydrogenase
MTPRRNRRHCSQSLPAIAPVSLLLLAAMGPVDGKRIAENGTAGSPPCQSCHGAHYGGSPALHVPAIAGLDASFILRRLDHYGSPEGHNASMKAVALALAPEERRAVAAYLSALPRAGDATRSAP